MCIRDRFYILDVTEWHAFYIAPAIGVGCALILIMVRLYASLFSRIIYYMVSIYWGMLIYHFLFSIVFLIINAIHKLSKTWGLCVLFIPSMLLFLYGFISSFVLTVTTLDIAIPDARSNLSVVHLSDLHLGPIYGKSHVSRVVAEVKRLQPDIVVITGDLLDGSMKIEPDVLFPFNEIEADIYFSLGNHDDVFLGLEEVERTLRGSKIVLLNDEAVMNNDVNIIGIGYRLKNETLVNKLVNLNVTYDALNILLYHAPSLTLDELEGYNIQLHLGGHTHGGQSFPLYWDTLSPFKYVRGLRTSETGKTHVHISEGAGTAGPRLRMFSRSTITLLNIHP
eukprot:TRINITY_DN10121_c0_g1_i19.p1 TRINITY_DN10121_c0_g1~~TRINITY_DN10121_c0_g1_i19.p1  ORF type:complete len:337 (+),score=49.19 TRINITY_DN10121_c0_g1_i19:73-1083(+)